MATKVKEAAGAVERILLPRLNSIDGELKSINTRIDSVHKGVDEMDKRLTTKIDEMDKRLTTKIDEMDKRNVIQFESIRNGVRSLSEKVDLIKDVEKLKLEVAELKRRR
jgi:uncharacterized protein YicC (UPF0701 family)